MTDLRHLKLHRRKWYLQFRLPADIAARLGKTVLTKSLKTGDLAEAQRRRYEILAELEATFRAMRGAPNWRTPDGIVAGARQLAAEVTVGKRTQDEAEEGFHFQAFLDALDHDPEKLNLPEDTGSAYERGFAILRGSPEILLSEALKRHLEALEKTARASTVAARRRRVGALVDTWNDPPIVEITRRRLADHVGTLKGAVKTRRDTVSDITAFFHWCVDAGFVETSPAERLSRLIRETSRGVENAAARRPWTNEEVRELLRRIEDLKPTDYLRVLIPTALYSGMRLNEICSLRGRDIEDGCFVVREAKTRSSLRRVPIHSELRELVKELKADAFLIPDLKPGGADGKRGHEASKRFARLRGKWGFAPGLVFHGLRASFVSRLESAGVPVGVAEQIVGHRRQSMSYGRYSKGVDLEQLREAVEKVRYE